MLPFFAAVMPVVVLFCGLVLDVGMLQLRRIQLQSAADASALGTELEIERGSSPTQVYTIALGDASINGFTNGVNGVTVSVQQQPSTGPYAGDYDAIQVTVAQSVKTLFMGALNGGHTTVTAQAVVLVPPCSYLLGTNALNGIPFWGASAGWYSACPLYVNRAWLVDYFATANTLGANIAGASGASAVSGSTTPVARYNALAMSDPLAAITSPAYPGYCDHVLFTWAAVPTTLLPGVYCGGMTLVGSTITLSPGLYIITGGINWSLSTVTGAGVTLFLTQGGGSSYGQARITSTAVNLTAATDTSHGAVPTVVFFADRNWVRTSSYDFQSYLSSYYGDGLWYGINTGFSFLNSSGNVTGPNYFGIVADCIYFYATNMRPLENFSNVPGGNPFVPSASLVQ